MSIIVRAYQLSKGDRVKLLGVEHKVTQIKDGQIYLDWENRKGDQITIGANSQQKIELLIINKKQKA